MTNTTTLTDFHKTFYICSPYEAVISAATFKQIPKDFIVEENLGFELTGSGEHLCVMVKKTNANTNQVANALAKWANIPAKDVSFSGLKDKFAITTQWFSLRIPKQQLPSNEFSYKNDNSCAAILDMVWHQKKIGRGCHKNNAFTITLKDVQGNKENIEAQLEILKNQGFPNFFMAQRFGKDGNNLPKAISLFQRKKRFKREERSIVLSAARSYIFNAVLAERIKANTWQQSMRGDVFNLNGSGSIFLPEHIDDSINSRLQSLDIHPTACMWGKGSLKSSDEVLALENQMASMHPMLASGLESAGLSQARRPLRAVAQDLAWQFTDNDTLVLSFKLTSGSYATAVLACLIADFIG